MRDRLDLRDSPDTRQGRSPRRLLATHMRPIRTHNLGDVQLSLLDGGSYLLDGGTLFGRVPRSLWERHAPPDAGNRVRLVTNIGVIRRGDSVIIVDAGLGPTADRFDAKLKDIYDFDDGPGLKAGLAALDILPEQVDAVVFSHLHFDHVGEVLRDPLPRAKYYVRTGEWEDASCPHELCRGSYLAKDHAALAALAEQGRVIRIGEDSTQDVAPGVQALRTGGHTRDHQVVTVESSDGRTALFWGDLLPTRAHVKPNWVMALDLYPMEVVAARRKLLETSRQGDWLAVLYHETTHPFCHVRHTGRTWQLEPTDSTEVSPST